MCWALRIIFKEISEVLQSLEARGKRYRKEGNLFHNAGPAGDYLDTYSTTLAPRKQPAHLTLI